MRGGGFSTFRVEGRLPFMESFYLMTGWLMSLPDQPNEQTRKRNINQQACDALFLAIIRCIVHHDHMIRRPVNSEQENFRSEYLVVRGL